MNGIDDILASVAAPQHDPRLLDLQALTRAWVNERGSPELLPYPTELMDRTMARLRERIDEIETMSSTADPSANFRLIIFQTELERFKYLIRTYLRARIAKIDKYAQHYLKSADSGILSALEQQYLESHTALLTAHYNAAFLSSFPSSLQRMDDVSGGISMVDAPDLDTAVFVKVLRDSDTIEIYGQYETSELELTRGDICVVRWSSISQKVQAGDVEVI